MNTNNPFLINKNTQSNNFSQGNNANPFLKTTNTQNLISSSNIQPSITNYMNVNKPAPNANPNPIISTVNPFNKNTTTNINKPVESTNTNTTTYGYRATSTNSYNGGYSSMYTGNTYNPNIYNAENNYGMDLPMIPFTKALDYMKPINLNNFNKNDITNATLYKTPVMRDEDSRTNMKSHSINHLGEYFNFSTEELRYFNWMKKRNIEFDENSIYAKITKNDKASIFSKISDPFLSPIFDNIEQNRLNEFLSNLQRSEDTTFIGLRRNFNTSNSNITSSIIPNRFGSYSTSKSDHANTNNMANNFFPNSNSNNSNSAGFNKYYNQNVNPEPKFINNLGVISGLTSSVTRIPSNTKNIMNNYYNDSNVNGPKISPMTNNNYFPTTSTINSPNFINTNDSNLGTKNNFMNSNINVTSNSFPNNNNTFRANDYNNLNNSSGIKLIQTNQNNLINTSDFNPFSNNIMPSSSNFNMTYNANNNFNSNNNLNNTFIPSGITNTNTNPLINFNNSAIQRSNIDDRNFQYGYNIGQMNIYNNLNNLNSNIPMNISNSTINDVNGFLNQSLASFSLPLQDDYDPLKCLENIKKRNSNNFNDKLLQNNLVKNLGFSNLNPTKSHVVDINQCKHINNFIPKDITNPRYRSILQDIYDGKKIKIVDHTESQLLKPSNQNSNNIHGGISKNNNMGKNNLSNRNKVINNHRVLENNFNNQFLNQLIKKDRNIINNNQISQKIPVVDSNSNSSLTTPSTDEQFKLKVEFDWPRLITYKAIANSNVISIARLKAKIVNFLREMPDFEIVEFKSSDIIFTIDDVVDTRDNGSIDLNTLKSTFNEDSRNENHFREVKLKAQFTGANNLKHRYPEVFKTRTSYHSQSSQTKYDEK